MVDEKSLRIGNWLMYKGKPYQVVGLMDSMVMIKFKCGSREWDLREEFAPIPLTPQMLAKMGFNKGGFSDSGYYWNDHIQINESIVDKQYHYAVFASEWELGEKFTYLHQLQNVQFSLFGTELNYTP